MIITFLSENDERPTQMIAIELNDLIQFHETNVVKQ